MERKWRQIMIFVISSCESALEQTQINAVFDVMGDGTRGVVRDV